MNTVHLVFPQSSEPAAPLDQPRLEQPVNLTATRPKPSPARRADLVVTAGTTNHRRVGTADGEHVRETPGGEWWDRLTACAAVSPRGVFAFGTALRLHGLACFDDYDQLDVLCPKGWNPPYPADVRLRHTRGLTDDDVTSVTTPIGEVRVLGLATTLVLLGSVIDESSLDRAVAEALRRGLTADRLRSVAQRWSTRGRVGPPLLIRVLDDRLGRRLPERWFERVASVLARQVGDDRVVRDHRVGGTLGRRAVELRVAVPSARVAVVERPTAPVQHQLRDRGWSLVNVGWRDADRAALIATRVAMAVGYRTRAAA